MKIIIKASTVLVRREMIQVLIGTCVAGSILPGTLMILIGRFAAWVNCSRLGLAEVKLKLHEFKGLKINSVCSVLVKF